MASLKNGFFSRNCFVILRIRFFLVFPLLNVYISQTSVSPSYVLLGLRVGFVHCFQDLCLTYTECLLELSARKGGFVLLVCVLQCFRFACFWLSRATKSSIRHYKKADSSISFLYDIVPPGVSVAVAFAVFTTFGFLMLWYRAGAHLNNIFVSRQLHSYSLKYSFSFSLPLFNSITKLCVVFKSIIS